VGCWRPVGIAESPTASRARADRLVCYNCKPKTTTDRNCPRTKSDANPFEHAQRLLLYKLTVSISRPGEAEAPIRPVAVVQQRQLRVPLRAALRDRRARG
jgi:hypothetical protein